MKNSQNETFSAESLYLTITETARRTGLSAGFIRAGVKSGRFPAIRCGNRSMVCLPGLLDVLRLEQSKNTK